MSWSFMYEISGEIRIGRIMAIRKYYEASIQEADQYLKPQSAD